MGCGLKYGLVKNTVFETSLSYATENNEVHIINDDSSFQMHISIYSNPSFGVVDFSKNTIIYVNVKTNYGVEIKRQGFLCKHLYQNKFIYTVHYSLSDQCKGSGLMAKNFKAWLLCPKLPVDAVIERNVVDINPF